MQNNVQNKKRKYTTKTKKYKKKDYLNSLIPKYSSKKTEIKTLDNWAGLSQITTIPQFFILNSPKLGSNFYNRIGNKINMKSVRIRFQLTDNPTSEGTSGTMFVRLLLFYDRQNNGLVTTMSDLLQLVNLDGTANSDTFGFINMNNAERYIILRDEIIPIFSNRNNQSTNAPTQNYISMIDGVPKNYFDWYVSLKGLETRFQNNDGDEFSIATGGLYLYVFSNISGGGGNVVPFTGYYNARLRFYD